MISASLLKNLCIGLASTLELVTPPCAGSALQQMSPASFFLCTQAPPQLKLLSKLFWFVRLASKEQLAAMLQCTIVPKKTQESTEVNNMKHGCRIETEVRRTKLTNAISWRHAFMLVTMDPELLKSLALSVPRRDKKRYWGTLPSTQQTL